MTWMEFSISMLLRKTQNSQLLAGTSNSRR